MKDRCRGIRRAQQILIDAKRKAIISKAVPFHGLRHSFATHLLKKGVDICYIKEIPGHSDIRTTERYVHVARNTLVNITSPLDDLREKDFCNCAFTQLFNTKSA